MLEPGYGISDLGIVIHGAHDAGLLERVDAERHAVDEIGDQTGDGR